MVVFFDNAVITTHVIVRPAVITGGRDIGAVVSVHLTLMQTTSILIKWDDFVGQTAIRYRAVMCMCTTWIYKNVGHQQLSTDFTAVVSSRGHTTKYYRNCWSRILSWLVRLRYARLWRGSGYLKSMYPRWSQGAVSIRKMVLPGMAIPMLKIRRPNGRLIFNMEIAIRR